MKKVLAIFLLLVYGVTTSGFTINLHYCCGKLKDVTFSGKKQHTCLSTKDGFSKEKKCCDNQELNAKISVTQSLNIQAIQVFKSVLTLPPSFVSLQQAQDVYLTRSDNDPPQTVTTADIPLFIQHCVFRI